MKVKTSRTAATVVIAFAMTGSAFTGPAVAQGACTGAVTATVSGSVYEFTEKHNKRVTAMALGKLTAKERALVKSKADSPGRQDVAVKVAEMIAEMTQKEYAKSRTKAMTDAWARQVKSTCGAAASPVWARAKDKKTSCSIGMGSGIADCTASAVPASTAKKKG